MGLGCTGIRGAAGQIDEDCSATLYRCAGDDHQLLLEGEVPHVHPSAVVSYRRGSCGHPDPPPPPLDCGEAQHGPRISGTPADVGRSKPVLIAETALLRQQLIILPPSVTRPRCTLADRARLVLLAGRPRTWRSALLIVQPETVRPWHRHLCRY